MARVVVNEAVLRGVVLHGDKEAKNLLRSLIELVFGDRAKDLRGKPPVEGPEGVDLPPAVELVHWLTCVRDSDKGNEWTKNQISFIGGLYSALKAEDQGGKSKSKGGDKEPGKKEGTDK